MIKVFTENGRKGFRSFLCVSYLAFLFLGVACTNNQQTGDQVAAVAAVKMNVLYIGLDNPVSIAVSGYNATDLKAEVDNGQIIGENGAYVIRPASTGSLKVSVFAKDKLVNETEFRVKTVPDPSAAIAGKRGGKISLEEVINAGKLDVDLNNFDFAMNWEVTEFVISVTVGGFTRSFNSKSAAITEDQIDLLKKLYSGSRFCVEDIKAKGPDGAVRNLSPLIFDIQ